MRIFPKEEFNFKVSLAKDEVINMMKQSMYDNNIKFDGYISNDVFKFTPKRLHNAPEPIIKGKVSKCGEETCVSGVIRMLYLNNAVEVIITLFVLYTLIILEEFQFIIFGIAFILIGRIIYWIRKDKLKEEFAELFGLDIDDIKNTINK